MQRDCTPPTVYTGACNTSPSDIGPGDNEHARWDRSVTGFADEQAAVAEPLAEP